MHSFHKPLLVKSDLDIQPKIQTKEKSDDSGLIMAVYYHREAARHQQEGNYKEAAQDIVQALNYYRKLG